MTQLWHIHVKGKQREAINMGLLVQAIIQFARELEADNTKSFADQKGVEEDK